MTKTKVAVIGAGYVGEITAFALTSKELANEVVIVDIIEDMPKGKGLDMRETTPIIGSDTHVYGSNDYADIAGAQIVVVTAGMPRKPGMDRMDLLKVNLKICTEVMNNVKQHAPDAFIIYVANPVDVLTYVASGIMGIDKKKVFGMAGILDTARYRAFIAMEANVSVKDIRAMVLGGHGDSMVPLTRLTSVGGVPLSEFLPQDKIDAIATRTRKGGGEIVALLKTGSAYYAPGYAVAEMVEAILKNQNRILPVIAYFDGEYGFSDVYAGAPVVLNKNGVDKILQIDLTEDEKEAYQVSLEKVKKGIEEAKEILKTL